jgi:hypothetical protein
LFHVTLFNTFLVCEVFFQWSQHSLKLWPFWP